MTKITDAKLKKLKTNYTYSNIREVCDDMLIDYDEFKHGGKRKKLQSRLEENFDITKISRNKLMLQIKTSHRIDLAKKKNSIKDDFKYNSNISKIFQALLTNYLINQKEKTGERVHYLSMGEIVDKIGVVGNNHSKYNKDRDIDKMKDKAASKYDLENVIYTLNKWDEKHFKAYYKRHYKNGYSLYKRALDNLEKIGVLQYYKGHRISFNIIKDGFIKDSNQHVFAHKELRDAVFNGQWRAWLYMKDRFDLRANPSKSDFNANTSELFSRYNNNFFNLIEYYEDIKSELKFSDDDKLLRYEYRTMNVFKSNGNDMSFYDLFKKYSCWFIAREMEKYRYSGYDIEVKYYYNAYEIVTKDLAIEEYSKNVISEMVEKYDAKNEQYGYIKKGFKDKDDLELLKELAFFMIHDERPENSVKFNEIEGYNE
jgi:hypothetical protein